MLILGLQRGALPSINMYVVYVLDPFGNFPIKEDHNV